jgi:hypothetical protein
MVMHALEPSSRTRGDHGCGLPMAMWTARHEPLPAWSPPAEPRHVCFGGRLVDDDESTGCKLALPGLPLAPRFGDIGPRLFGGVERLFLYVSPSATRA